MVDNKVQIFANKTEPISRFRVEPLCYRVLSDISYLRVNQLTQD